MSTHMYEGPKCQGMSMVFFHFYSTFPGELTWSSQQPCEISKTKNIVFILPERRPSPREIEIVQGLDHHSGLCSFCVAYIP